MTRLLATALVCALMCSTPTPAWAYLKFGVQIGSTVRDVRWNQTIRYFVTERAVAGVTATEFRDAIGRAFATWTGVSSGLVRAELQGATIATPGTFDLRTTLGFLDRPDLERVLGATSFLLDATTGEIIESDVFFNTRFDWSVAASGQPSRIDLESVALHEIGHLLGLGHSAIGETELQPGGGRRVIGSGAVMFPIAMSAGSIADRVLQPDDEAGLLDLYPSTAASESSSISGRVTRNSQGVFGAHVVTFHLETGTLIAGFTLSRTGEFVIAGLDPGPHLVRVEPLDDADATSFFTGDIDVNFQVTFARQIVVAPRDGSSDDITIEVRSR
ncbi:MAG: matrixin family metalloprotease [Acidobacteria bacterium]|nr:matrixin family metalloprotease [Acidobacteriota bacterium]